MLFRSTSVIDYRITKKECGTSFIVIFEKVSNINTRTAQYISVASQVYNAKPFQKFLRTRRHITAPS